MQKPLDVNQQQNHAIKPQETITKFLRAMVVLFHCFVSTYITVSRIIIACCNLVSYLQGKSLSQKTNEGGLELRFCLPRKLDDDEPLGSRFTNDLAFLVLRVI